MLHEEALRIIRAQSRSLFCDTQWHGYRTTPNQFSYIVLVFVQVEKLLGLEYDLHLTIDLTALTLTE